MCTFVGPAVNATFGKASILCSSKAECNSTLQLGPLHVFFFFQQFVMYSVNEGEKKKFSYLFT